MQESKLNLQWCKPSVRDDFETMSLGCIIEDCDCARGLGSVKLDQLDAGAAIC